MDKIKAFWSLFRQGEQVVDPAKWKNRQISINMLTAFLAAILATAKAFGYDIPLTNDDLVHIGGAVLAVVGLFNAGATVTTSVKVGLPAKPSEFPVIHSDPQVPAEPMSTFSPPNDNIKPADIRGTEYIG